MSEKFYGLTASEIAISSNTFSIYSVLVNSSVKTLQDSIKKKTGFKLNIYREGVPTKSGVPYLVDRGNDNSEFICETEEE